MPIFIPMQESAFSQSPSSKSSFFFANHQTICMFLTLMGELNKSKFEGIIHSCKTEQVHELVNVFNTNSHDSYLFSKAVREHLNIDYDSISTLHFHWGNYSTNDKIIVTRCFSWNRALQNETFDVL